MARSINSIQNLILDSIKADPVLGTKLTSPSKVAFYNLVSFVVAVAISLLEQVMDIYKGEIEKTVAKAPPLGGLHLQHLVKNWQYLEDSADPLIHEQYLKSGINKIMPDWTIGYEVVNPALRIITRAAVTTNGNRECLIKVLKNEPPEPLTTELTAFREYIHGIGAAGVNYGVVSELPDKIIIKGTIFHEGQYTTTIAKAVTDSIKLFLANLPFNGRIQVSSIVDAIQQVTGVTDIVLDKVLVRYNSLSNYINLMTVPSRTYETFSGSVVEETISGQSFLDTIIFTPSSYN